MTSPKIINTSSVRIECHPDGFIRAMPEPSEHTLTEARATLAVYRQHAEEIGHKVRLLVDMRRVAGLSREARLLYQSEETAAISTGAALLIDSGISKVIGNFVIGLNKGPVEARLFTSEDEAKAWLDTLEVE